MEHYYVDLQISCWKKLKKRYIIEKRPNATLSQKLCECNKQIKKLVCVFLLVLYDFVKFRPHATTMMFYRLEYIYYKYVSTFN